MSKCFYFKYVKRQSALQGTQSLGLNNRNSLLKVMT